MVLPPPDPDFEDDQEKKVEKFKDDLDRHVDDVLKRPSKFRRTMRGVWAFLKTRKWFTLYHAFVNHFVVMMLAMGVCFYFIFHMVSHWTCVCTVQIITAIYGFLVGGSHAYLCLIRLIGFSVFWGAAIVLFLAKIINLHNANTQGFWVEVSSQVENGK